MSANATDTERKVFAKPKCPKCNNGNVRCRKLPEFETKPMVCNVCGFEWKPE